MFYLIDLVEDTKKAFETKRDVLSYWRWRIIERGFFPFLPRRLTFDDLNVTGKDMRIIRTYNGSILNVYAMELRRFQVLDDNGRPCDIRTWKTEIKLVEDEVFPSWCSIRENIPSSEFRKEPVPYCGVFHMRKGHGKAFMLQKMKDTKNKMDLDEDDYLGFAPVRDHTKVRTPDIAYRARKRSPVHSWKTQSKNRSQWGRHQGKFREENWKELLARAQSEEAG